MLLLIMYFTKFVPCNNNGVFHTVSILTVPKMKIKFRSSYISIFLTIFIFSKEQSQVTDALMTNKLHIYYAETQRLCSLFLIVNITL